MKTGQIIEKLTTLEGSQLEQFIDQRIDELTKNQLFLDNHGKRQIIGRLSGPRAYRTFLDDKKTNIVVSSGLINLGYKFDSTKDITNMLAKECKQREINSSEDICEIVTKVTFDYFGGMKVEGEEEDRLKYIEEDKENYISNLKNSKKAWCTERATTMHQLFKMLGVDSQIVFSAIDNQNNEEIHAFNMVRSNQNKCTYLLDSALVDYSQEEHGYNSIVQKLPYESFNTFEGVKKRTLIGANGKEKIVDYNPNGSKLKVIDEKIQPESFKG